MRSSWKMSRQVNAILRVMACAEVVSQYNTVTQHWNTIDLYSHIF